MKAFKTILISALFISLAAKPAFALTLPGIQRVVPSVIPKLACQILKDKVIARITKFDTNKDKHVENYTIIKERISEKIAYWKGLGYDVDQISKDLKTLDDKIKKFATDYATFIDKLKNTENYTCGSSAGQFETALAEARAALKIVRQDVADIRSFYWGTIRPDIMKLKQQTPVVKED
jgi:hypothetical protein